MKEDGTICPSAARECKCVLRYGVRPIVSNLGGQRMAGNLRSVFVDRDSLLLLLLLLLLCRRCSAEQIATLGPSINDVSKLFGNSLSLSTFETDLESSKLLCLPYYIQG